MKLSLDLPFNQRSRKRDEIVAIDLGGRTTKAIHVRRKGAGMTLVKYAIVDAPLYEKTLTVDVLAAHLKAVSQTLDAKPSTPACQWARAIAWSGTRSCHKFRWRTCG